MKDIRLVSTATCTSCMACVDSCTKGSLSAVIDSNGFYKINRDASKCTNCGLCLKVCPVINAPQLSNILEKPFAVWNENFNVRKQSASGGAFAALAEAVLKQRGVVYGASINKFEVIHCRIDRIEELYKILGSKYQHSNTSGCYTSILRDLKDGKLVLFGAMSCQVAGLVSYITTFSGEKYLRNLYTIDTICGGLSTMLPMLHLKDTCKYKSIISFRDKSNGWKSVGFQYALKMEKNDNSIENLMLDNLVLNAFSSKLTKRSSCLNCKFTSKNRFSDATIGDYWGDREFEEQHSLGLSVLVVHNNRIKSLLINSELHMESVSLSSIIRYNHNYCWTHYPIIKKFISRKIVFWALRNKKNKMVQYCLKATSIPGLIMRIYLKINNIERYYYEKNNNYICRK